jgi:hypothetical protein
MRSVQYHDEQQESHGWPLQGEEAPCRHRAAVGGASHALSRHWNCWIANLVCWTVVFWANADLLCYATIGLEPLRSVSVVGIVL